jgi:hypothetical protein
MLATFLLRISRAGAGHDACARVSPSSAIKTQVIELLLAGLLPCTPPHQGPWCLVSSRDTREQASECTAFPVS